MYKSKTRYNDQIKHFYFTVTFSSGVPSYMLNKDKKKKENNITYVFKSLNDSVQTATIPLRQLFFFLSFFFW